MVRRPHMKHLQLLRAALAVLVLAATSIAQRGVGAPLPELELEGFSQTKAKTLEDYSGRALLIELFAYW